MLELPEMRAEATHANNVFTEFKNVTHMGPRANKNAEDVIIRTLLTWTKHTDSQARTDLYGIDLSTGWIQRRQETAASQYGSSCDASVSRGRDFLRMFISHYLYAISIDFSARQLCQARYLL